MIIQRKESEEEGLYFIEENEVKVAEMEFRLRPNRLIIIHTIVHAGFEGKGYGKMLVEKAITDAREGRYTIVPICKFAKFYFERHPEAKGVL